MEDRMEFYDMKDEFLSQIVNNTPEELAVSVYYIPFYKYSKETKDKAGELMRESDEWRPFKYYLSLIEPSSEDTEVTEKATIEVEIVYNDRIYSFHTPQDKAQEWGLDIEQLPRKSWLSGRDYYKERFDKIKVELNELMEEVIF